MIHAHLENARLRIQDEIHNYPPPIPACDAYFNHLLEERARIGEELNGIQVAAGENLPAPDKIARIEQWLQSSNYLGEVAKHEIRLCLNAVHT